MSSQTSIRRDVNIRLNAFRTDAPAGAPDLKAADLANHLEDFRLSTDVHEALAQYRPHDARSAPAGDLTQSERDWAFAKRALARGDDPEEILRRIADYRGEEKHPSYARYTVEKAQATLQRKFGELSSAGGETTQAIEPSRE